MSPYRRAGLAQGSEITQGWHRVNIRTANWVDTHSFGGTLHDGKICVKG